MLSCFCKVLAIHGRRLTPQPIMGVQFFLFYPRRGGGVLFPLPVADEGNNATVPRSKKAKEKCEAPAGLFGHRKRVPNGVHNGNFNYCFIHNCCNKKEITALSWENKRLFLKPKFLRVNRLSVNTLHSYYTHKNKLCQHQLSILFGLAFFCGTVYTRQHIQYTTQRGALSIVNFYENK